MGTDHDEVKGYVETHMENADRIKEVSDALYDKFWEYRLIYDIYVDDDVSEYSIVGLYQVLDTIDEREKKCILLRYRNGYTYRQVAEAIGKTQERARQIVSKGLRKLKHPTRGIYIRKRPGDDILEDRNAYGNALRKIDELEKEILVLRATEKDIRNMTNGVINALKDINIENLNLEIRTYNALAMAGYRTIGRILEAGSETIKRNVRNLGAKGFQNLVDALESYGIAFEEEEV